MDLPYYCRQCNSPRPETTCWKCRTDTIVPHPEWTNPRLPPIDTIRALAREVGYALAVHGTQQRDLDLVAVPWTPDAVPVQRLIDHLCQGLVFNDEPARVVGTREQKPHGRLAVNIQLHGWFKLIDLSITPLYYEEDIPVPPKIPQKLTTELRERIAVRFYGYVPKHDAQHSFQRMHAAKALDRLKVPRVRSDLNEDQITFLLSTL